MMSRSRLHPPWRVCWSYFLSLKLSHRLDSINFPYIQYIIHIFFFLSLAFPLFFILFFLFPHSLLVLGLAMMKTFVRNWSLITEYKLHSICMLDAWKKLHYRNSTIVGGMEGTFTDYSEDATHSYYSCHTCMIYIYLAAVSTEHWLFLFIGTLVTGCRSYVSLQSTQVERT